MSTNLNDPAKPASPIRAALTVKDKSSSFHIRIEPQGDPASIALLCWRACRFAWPLPGFEAGDWAAGFLAAAKPRRVNDSVKGGTILALSGHWRDQGELDYRYEVTASEGQLAIKAWRRDRLASSYRLSFAFAGTLEELFAFARLEPPAAVPRRYLALFQGPETELFVLAFDGTEEEADELEARLDRARALRLLVTGLVVTALGPFFEIGAESIHLMLDGLFNSFPPREAPKPSVPEGTPPPDTTSGPTASGTADGPDTPPPDTAGRPTPPTGDTQDGAP